MNGVFKPGQFAGYDLAQFYGEVHLPFLTKGGLDVKGGRWYTLAGYEVVPATGRPLLSVPYMFNYGQPFTHMGVVTTLHLTDKLNLYNGTINGWDRFIDQRYHLELHRRLHLDLQGRQDHLAFTTRLGPESVPQPAARNQQIYPTGYVNVPSIAGLHNPGYHRNDRTLFTTVLTHKWTDKLTQVMETDQGWERRVPGLARRTRSISSRSTGPRERQLVQLRQLVPVQLHDKFMGVWRSEVFWDESGVRTGQVDGNTRQAHLMGDRFYEMTLGAQIKPHDGSGSVLRLVTTGRSSIPPTANERGSRS